MMLLSRLSWPTNEPPNGPSEYWGLRRAKSLIRSRMVGRFCRTSRLTAVAAPVRAELNTSDVCAVTVTSSVMAAWLRVSWRSVATPRLTITSLTDCGWKPVSVAVTLYGPPTRMPGSEKRPSARVVAS